MAVPDLPEQIHRYRILSELGRGSMGRVYLAEDPNLGRRIALKVLSPQLLAESSEERELRLRFFREVRAVGRLDHPGIVNVYDADSDPVSGVLYLAMEWIRGRTLSSLLAAERVLTLDTAVSLAAQVARALDYAHRREVIHRDVKPSNLLVTDDRTVKLVDFGIAKLVSGSLTQPGVVLGTPCYMAPEHVRGDAVDGRSDLFSLGAVLYECATGRLAFTGDRDLARLRVLAADPRPPEVYNPQVPPSLRAVIGQCLEKCPTKRFQTGHELAQALDAIREELDSGRPEPEPTPVRPAGAPAAGAASATDDSGGDVGSELEPTQIGARRAEARPSEAPTSARRTLAKGLRGAALALAAVALLVLFARLPERLRRPEPASEADRSDLVEPRARAASIDSAAPAPQDPGIPSPDGLPAELPQADRPAPPEPAPDISERHRTANLEVIHANRLRLAYLTVLVNGERILTERMEASSPWARMRGKKLRRRIEVPEGEHSLEVHISGVSKELEARKLIYESFSEGELKRLHVRLRPAQGRLDLVWE